MISVNSKLELHRKSQASQNYTMRPCQCEKERLGRVGKRNGVEGEREEGKGGSRYNKLRSIVRLQSM